MVYDKTQKKVVPISERQDRPIVDRSGTCRDGFYVMPDIEPYEGVGFEGKPVVTSRSHHRELLRQHGVVEVGNEKPAWMKELEYERAHGRKD
jgi:hypothetical protein